MNKQQYIPFKLSALANISFRLVIKYLSGNHSRSKTINKMNPTTPRAKRTPRYQSKQTVSPELPTYTYTHNIRSRYARDVMVSVYVTRSQ